MNKRAVGNRYEKLAREYLETQGVKVIEQNYRCRRGEIDLIVLDQDTLVFVEVKYRKNLVAGSPAEAVDFRKQKRICEIAEYYLYSHGISSGRGVRYDVIAICADEVEWYQNAFYHIGTGY